MPVIVIEWLLAKALTGHHNQYTIATECGYNTAAHDKLIRDAHARFSLA